MSEGKATVLTQKCVPCSRYHGHLGASGNTDILQEDTIFSFSFPSGASKTSWANYEMASQNISSVTYNYIGMTT